VTTPATTPTPAPPTAADAHTAGDLYDQFVRWRDEQSKKPAVADADASRQRCHDAWMQKPRAPAPTVVEARQASAAAHAGMIDRLNDGWKQKSAEPEHAALVERYQNAEPPQSTAPVVVAAQQSAAEAHAAMVARTSNAWKRAA
jgi:hypothetical protein